MLGSGIASVGFTRDAEASIRAADRVFFCVADPATVVWIRKLRPDAHDLYVFYDEGKPRYHTYVQMSEAVLHPVRQGEKVVVIYYGHPGIFVLSTHRAIEIARREGHRAVMKAGISALDCLCADLGVDPCHPGMMTHEATDLLIRQRDPDPGLHVVLWQVGLIGKMGFRRRGFVNDKFQIFAEYLQSFYGEDYEITHYIAARYPTLEPTVEVYALSELLDPAVQLRITGLSTFYIPPKHATPTDVDMATRLELIKPGQTLRPASATRRIADYGERELRAIREFASFEVPMDYQHQPLSRASEFLIELTDNPELHDRYRDDPEAAVESFAGLSARERAALLARDEGAIQIAAKGSRLVSSPHDSFITSVLRSGALARDLQQTIKIGLREDRLPASVDQWMRERGYAVRPKMLPASIAAVNATLLLPWTGAYYCVEHDLLVAILGDPATRASLIYVNDERIRQPTFYNGALAWQASEGNPHSGLLRVRPGSLRKGPRELAGVILHDGGERVELKARDMVELPVSAPRQGELARFATTYTVRGLSEATAELATLRLDAGGLVLGETAIDGVEFEADALRWATGSPPLAHGNLRFLVDPFTKMRFFFGRVGDEDDLTGRCNYFGHAQAEPGSACGDAPAGVSARAWAGLRALSETALREHHPPFWHEWQKVRFTTQVINRSLASIIPLLSIQSTNTTTEVTP
ncbi:Tetrapyrrole (Corrin/Porphyrin) Methylase [Enhygromyxa salina]|uniref:Tetrapyrrole (Corrin/Porphyrin) Methylase n=1 Tax=Enhygromyxa salina TaxID=215803 RepID=A0A2S9YUL0_9BACT|nr:Tetrapyrrole (Corrin/Porphyrin) Methylase [Enhygromyxa salina]